MIKLYLQKKFGVNNTIGFFFLFYTAFFTFDQVILANRN